FRFTGSPPAWRASRRPHGTRLPVPHAAPHELRLPPSGTTRDRARCSSSSRPARSGGSATKTASSRGDRPAAAASLRPFLLLSLRLRDPLGQGRAHGLPARGPPPFVANPPVRIEDVDRRRAGGLPLRGDRPLAHERPPVQVLLGHHRLDGLGVVAVIVEV